MICVHKKGDQYVPTVQHFRPHENTDTLPCTKGMLRGDMSLNQEQGNTLFWGIALPYPIRQTVLKQTSF